MKKSKKKYETILQKIRQKSKKRTTKNKPGLKKCKEFCKKDYLVEMNKVFKENAKKYNFPYKSPTKQDHEFAYTTCKKTFCNEKCKGYDFFGDTKAQVEFQKKITNGFQNAYTKPKADMLKKRGALSGCVYIDEYNAFHK